MNEDLNFDNFPPELTGALIGISILVVARMIGARQVHPDNIKTEEQFFQIVSRFGTDIDHAFEVQIARVAERLNSINNCSVAGDHESAVVLLYTLIEGEVNTAIQVILRVKGFTNSSISSALRGTDLKTKLDVLLPLLGVDPGERVRQLAFESQAIRNAIVHYKAQPSIWMNDGHKDGEHDAVTKKAAAFMSRNPVSQFNDDLTNFTTHCVYQCEEVQAAYELFGRFVEIPS